MKKALSLVLAGTLAISTAATAFATTSQVVKDVDTIPGAIGTTTSSGVLPYFDANGIRYVVDIDTKNPSYTLGSENIIRPDGKIMYKLHIFNQLDSGRTDLNTGNPNSGELRNPVGYANAIAAQKALNKYTALLNSLQNAAQSLPTLPTDRPTSLTENQLKLLFNVKRASDEMDTNFSNTAVGNELFDELVKAGETAANGGSEYFTFTDGTHEYRVFDNTALETKYTAISTSSGLVTYAMMEELRVEALKAVKDAKADVSANELGVDSLATRLSFAIAAEKADVINAGISTGLGNLSSIPLSVNLKFAKGAAQFKKGKIEKINNTWYATVQAIDPYISVNEVDVEFELYLAQNGTSNVSDTWEFFGKMGNLEQIISYSQSNNTQYSGVNTAKVWKGQNESGNGVFDFGDNVFADFYVSAEKKYYLNMSRKENEEIIKAYPKAALTFFDFMGNYDTFSRIGKVYIPESLVQVDENTAPYIYELIGDELVPVDFKKSTIPNKDVKSYMFETKSLGYYVVSDIDLATEGDITTEETPDDDKTDEPSKNPGTGSNDFVSIAVVAAVLSLAAAGAVAFKKASK